MSRCAQGGLQAFLHSAHSLAPGPWPHAPAQTQGAAGHRWVGDAGSKEAEKTQVASHGR